MKKFNFISMLLVALLCSANMWGVPVEITPENPYTNSFDTETTYAVPTGWTKVAGNTYNPGIDSKNDWSGYTRNSSAKALFFMGYLATGDQIVALPQFSDDIKYLTVDFYYKTKSSSYPATMSVGYITNLSSKSTYVAKSTLSYSSEGWTHFNYTFDENTPDGAYIAISFAGTNSSSSKKGLLSVEDITVTTSYVAPATSCAKPKNLTKSGDTPEGATFTWEQNTEETTYQWACVASGAEVTEWNTLGENVRTKTVTGLTAGTAYDFHVRSYCGAGEGEQSASTKSTFTPTCPAPTAPVVSGISANGATLSWTAATGISDYQYIVVASGADQDWNAPTLVEGATTTTLSGLNASTNYDVYVRSYYSATTQSTAVKASFQTACSAVTIPFTWDFSDLGCWTKDENCHSSTGVSNGAFRFYYKVTPPYQTLISPEFVALSSTVDVKFDYKAQSTSWAETFALGYSTTTSDLASFTWLEDETVTNTTYAQYEKTLPAGVKYIAIQCKSNNQYYLYIDNFRIEETPSCAAPTALTVTDITTNSASVSWTSEAASFALEYKKTSDADWTAATAPIASPFALEGLTPNETEYTVRVKAICGENNESEWTELAEPFKTDCEAKTVTKETAWTENFEALTANQAPACWDEISSLRESAYMQVNAAAAKDGSLGLQIYVYGTHSDIVKLPVFSEETKNLKLSFDYKNQGETSNYGELEVGYYASNGYTTVATMTKTTAFAASGEIEMPNDAPADARIAFRVLGIKNNYYSHAYIDNLVVSRKPTCAVPTNLQAVATSEGAVVTWDDDLASEWTLHYQQGDLGWNTPITGITTKSYTLTGLTLGVYEVQVKAVCGAGDESAWTASVPFTPVCAAPTALTVTARSTNAATLTWEGTESAFKLQTSLDGETWADAIDVNAKTYDLTSLAAGTTYFVRVQSACGSDYATTSFTTWCDLKAATELPLNITAFTAVPDCWEINFVGENSGIANNKIFFYGDAEQMAALPAYDIELNKLSVTFGFSTTASLEFGYLDEPNGTFHAFASQPTTGVELNLENEPAAAKYIAIRYTATSAYASGSISSVLLRKTPTCEKPVDVTATPAVGAASIDWTSEATAWNLQYKLASATDWTDAAVTAKPFELTSLAQGASYKVRVQANCGDELSNWSDEIPFTTNCSSIDALPYYADFTQALSSCWVVFAQNDSYYKPTVNTAMQQLTMNGGKDGSSNNVVVMPPFSADLTDAVISLEYSCSTGANYAQLEVGYVTNKADATTFQALQTLDRNGSWTEARVAAAAVPANAYIAFRYAGASSHGDLAIRNLRVIEALTLADNTDNTALLAANTGKTLDVQINRTFVCADYYNTLCLPFDLPTLDGTPLAGGELWAFKYATVDQTTDELLFRIIEAESIEAGVPYFIAFPAGDNIVNPTFKNVTISATTGQNIGDASVAQFCGIIEKPVVFAAHDETKLFLAENNTLYWWDGDDASQLNNFRAYFLVNTNSGANNAPRHGMRARIIKEEQVITGVENVQTNNEPNTKVLKDGILYILHNGKVYNVQGQLVD